MPDRPSLPILSNLLGQFTTSRSGSAGQQDHERSGTLALFPRT